MNWPWKKDLAYVNALKRAQEAAESAERALEDVVGRLDDLEKLTADLEQMPIEWATTLDKLNRWASRQAARERKRTHEALDAIEAPSQQTEVQDPRLLTKAQLRHRVQQMRSGNNVPSHKGQ